MKALLGRKVGMSQVFSPEGEVVPVTLICADTNYVTVRRTDEKDGYAAIQLGLLRKGAQLEKGLPKKPGEQKRAFAYRREFKGEFPEDVSTFDVGQFEVGDTVQVSGKSKGKGYQGVVKRHGFKGGPASHGHRHALRQSGSIGGAFPQHVFKGVRMAGRMGHDRVTVKNLQIVSVDPDKRIIAVKGAVPGARGSILEITSVV